MRTIRQEIAEFINNLEIIDTHEHLPGFEKERNGNLDILQEYTLHYFRTDLISAGMTEADFEETMRLDIPVHERWKRLEPAWESARNTAYGRVLDLLAQDLYGEDGFSASSIESLDRKFKAKREQGRCFKEILKDRSKIKFSVLDSIFPCDPEFFRTSQRLDYFIIEVTGKVIRNLEREFSTRINDLDTWEQLAEEKMKKHLAEGCVSLKCGLAYWRPLLFPPVERTSAQKGFQKLLAQNKETLSTDDIQTPGHNGMLQLRTHAHGNPKIPTSMDQDIIAFQNHMMHHLLRLANAKGLTFQFHTGLQEGNYNFIPNTDPLLMNSLFMMYPNVRFVLFHMGYPFQHALPALAKIFPNVYLDLCWVHIVSPVATRRFLEEVLDSVPSNKITAFGGDFLFIDGVYGHQKMARNNVVEVLAEMSERGDFSIKESCSIAERILRKNAEQLYS
jgi:hypothetical protein